MKKREVDYEDAFMREVEEDLKNETMRKFWEKYGLYIIILVVAALTLAVSYETVKSWYVKRAENWSDSYAVALSLQNQKRYNESIDTLDFIIDKDYGIYVDLSDIQKANVLFDEGKTEEALNILKEISKNSKFTAPLREAATIKLASYLVDTASSEEINQLLSPLANNEKSSWYPLANDLLATVALRDNNPELAKEIYDRIVQHEKTPDEMKERIKNIISLF